MSSPVCPGKGNGYCGAGGRGGGGEETSCKQTKSGRGGVVRVWWGWGSGSGGYWRTG